MDIKDIYLDFIGLVIVANKDVLFRVDRGLQLARVDGEGVGGLLHNIHYSLWKSNWRDYSRKVKI